MTELFWVVAFVMGFVAGYGVRTAISHHRVLAKRVKMIG
jgi:hypothetical protein